MAVIGEPDRYRKQELCQNFGPEGQRRLAKSRVLLLGIGATGGHLATLLIRAGLGFMRIVDHDVPELSNLPRQVLYFEDDLSGGLPKAQLAARRLARMNRHAHIEPVVTRFDSHNALELMKDVDLVLDGLDNLASRYVLNDAAVKLGIPWVNPGVVAGGGNLMVVRPGQTACLRCLFPHPPDEALVPSCQSAGIMNFAPALAGAVGAAEAVKLLIGDAAHLLPGMLFFDLWQGSLEISPVSNRPDPKCPCCGKKLFPYLDHS